MATEPTEEEKKLNAKKALGDTIRGLRAYLLEHLHDAARSDYQLDIDLKKTSLPSARRARRARLEALGESVPLVVKRAAYTLINRLVVVKLLEGMGLRTQKLVTGGTESRAYRDFKALAPAIETVDDSEGYALALDLLYRELADELPGLFGDSGAASALRLIRVPGYVLREVIKQLDSRELETCWQDDMTLGWVYQYWNDPEREDLDAKLNRREKLEPGEIASKTQMFTERYMVDWLLQNSLGPMWLAMCQKHGWTAAANMTVDDRDSLLERLEARRVAWREQRERGEVELTALMPIEPDEVGWAYYVPQPLPAEAVEQAPESLDALKLLDPAVGSGHFLVVAFDLLLALHREEDRHRGRTRSDRQIAEHILEHNLYGIDLDPRAVQIAAAALWLKAKRVDAAAHPKAMNLVAAQLRLGDLKKDDPALVELRQAVYAETRIPAALTDKIVGALKGADWIGSLLKVEHAVEEAIAEFEGKRQFALGEARGAANGGAKEDVLALLEGFLAKKTGGEDLGLRLRGEQLAAGVRLVRMLREAQYDLVVGNPPYQGTSKMRETAYLTNHYPRGKADLYAMFLERGLQLVRLGGASALLTMRGWMFIKQYSELRQWLLQEFDLRTLGDFDRGAFELVPDEVVSVVVSLFAHRSPVETSSTALQPTPLDDRTRDSERTPRKRAATLAHVGRHEFRASDLRVVPEWPLVYWWPPQFLARYASAPLLRDLGTVLAGMTTGDNPRFARCIWEPAFTSLALDEGARSGSACAWVPYIKGAEGQEWVDLPDSIVNWRTGGLEKQVIAEFKGNKGGGNGTPSRAAYFQTGIAVTPLGQKFSARLHRFPGIFSNMGSSIFPSDLGKVLCTLNSELTRKVMISLNPGLHFEAGDVNRVPVFEIAESAQILQVIESAVTVHESHREPSVEFRAPGPSPWRHAQEWAQLAVDRAEGSPLPEYVEELDAEPATDHVSYALGVALGRFHPDGKGILDPRTADLSHALPHGILFLDGSLDGNELADSLGEAASAPLLDAWKQHRGDIAPKLALRDYLSDKFFAVHKAMYDNRPIHWPLSSDRKTFVAWVNIHRMDGQTLSQLRVVLSKRQRELQGQLNDALEARQSGSAKQKRDAEDRYAKLDKARQELDRFIDVLRQLDTRGPEGRAVDAGYDPDLDDGVMINSAALWPVLEPQWKDPKKWWKELSNPSGKKDYDWSHLAMRYFPARVDEKCQADPSLGVAHHCFWHYHPARAYAWELRLQDEIGPDFRITEAPYRDGPGDVVLRQRFIAEHPDDCLAAIEKEARRRRRKGPVATLRLLDPGLWTDHAAAVYELELALSEKQGSELFILAPDEPDARQAFEAQHPQRASDRRTLIGGLKPRELALDKRDDEDEATPDDDSNDDSE